MGCLDKEKFNIVLEMKFVNHERVLLRSVWDVG